MRGITSFICLDKGTNRVIHRLIHVNENSFYTIGVKMRKFSSIIILILSLVILASCGEVNDIPAPEIEQPEIEQPVLQLIVETDEIEEASNTQQQAETSESQLHIAIADTELLNTFSHVHEVEFFWPFAPEGIELVSLAIWAEVPLRDFGLLQLMQNSPADEEVIFYPGTVHGQIDELEIGHVYVITSFYMHGDIPWSGITFIDDDEVRRSYAILHNQELMGNDGWVLWEFENGAFEYPPIPDEDGYIWASSHEMLLLDDFGNPLFTKELPPTPTLTSDGRYVVSFDMPERYADFSIYLEEGYRLENWWTEFGFYRVYYGDALIMVIGQIFVGMTVEEYLDGFLTDSTMIYEPPTESFPFYTRIHFTEDGERLPPYDFFKENGIGGIFVFYSQRYPHLWDEKHEDVLLQALLSFEIILD
jgi:hypothetical protein